MSRAWEQRRRAAWYVYRHLMGTYPAMNGTLGVNPSGAQCVNLANLWFAWEGAGQRYGNAYEFAGYSTRSVEYRVMSSRTRLRVGDVVIYPQSVGRPMGHVAVILDGAKQAPLAMGLNSPDGSPVQLAEVLAADLEGYLRIRI